HVEDAAFDLPRVSGLQGRERPRREGDRAPREAVRDRPVQNHRADDRGGRGGPRETPRREQPAVHGAARDLRRAGRGRGAPPPSRLPGDRDLRALDRGDGGADHRHGRAPARAGVGPRRQCVTTRPPHPAPIRHVRRMVAPRRGQLVALLRAFCVGPVTGSDPARYAVGVRAAAEARARPVPLWRWAVWWVLLLIAGLLFYLLMASILLVPRAAR